VRALEEYLDGRTTGPLVVTTTGRRLDQPEAWRMIRRLARRASLDGADEIRPHSLRVAFITGAREAGVPSRTSKTPPATPTPAPPDATIAAATRWTATPPTPSRPG
jgi:integrase